MRPQRRERLGSQIFQPGAAVDQQCLAEHRAPPVPAVQDPVIAPLIEDPTRLQDRPIDGAENELGEVQPVECAQSQDGMAESARPDSTQRC
jgi:hypothetical protein